MAHTYFNFSRAVNQKFCRNIRLPHLLLPTRYTLQITVGSTSSKLAPNGLPKSAPQAHRHSVPFEHSQTNQTKLTKADQSLIKILKTTRAQATHQQTRDTEGFSTEKTTKEKQGKEKALYLTTTTHKLQAVNIIIGEPAWKNHGAISQEDSTVSKKLASTVSQQQGLRFPHQEKRNFAHHHYLPQHQAQESMYMEKQIDYQHMRSLTWCEN